VTIKFVVDAVARSKDADHVPAGIISEDPSGAEKKQARVERADKVRV